ncbi:type II toxin-antitoxin system VapC family toxin [Sphingomonas qilianensis]|uniref:Ribonuclease VapC n=1 Tax=Sphingomonas qilianensis TaxID=1736690 RepID=A0ABU9XQ69_9SPHN
MIVDASVALKWLVEEEDSDVARALLGGVELWAPILIHAEVGNAIWKKRRRGELGDDAELASLPGLLAFILRTIDETPMMDRALSLAIEMDHPVYDCVYLAVAEALDQELVTADHRFASRLSAYRGRARVRGLMQ